MPLRDEGRGSVTGSLQHEQWSEGASIDDPRLAAAVLDMWVDALTLAGDEVSGDAPVDFVTAQDMVREATMAIVGVLETATGAPDPGARLARAAHLLAALSGLSGDVRDAAFAYRVRAFGQVQAALGRLRSAGSVRQLLDLTPAELCRCGFDRAMFTRIEGGVGIPEAFHDAADPEWAREILRIGRGAPLQLDHMLLETEMIRRRGPLLVADALDDPRVHAVLRDATRTRSYVAAPIISHGRVIGFVHADCFHQRRMVDAFDRDLLWMFTEGFSNAYERTVLHERLRALRSEVRRANHSILTVMDEFCDAEVEVARVDGENGAVARSAAAVFVAPDSRLESLLTKRELDVIKLMAAGETNAGIATRLVVSEGTVKSHVKHILRKLRASNRAEAVSRFIKITQQDAAAAGR